MKKVATSMTTNGTGAVAKNGKATESGAVRRRVKRPDFLANLERLGYSEKVGARMLDKFHDSLS